MKKAVIGQFVVPSSARAEFFAQPAGSRSIVRQQPGLVTDVVYESLLPDGSSSSATTATWESEAVLQKAQAAVPAAYQKIGFNPAAMLARLHITQ